jgi:N,N'-diacetyllegionaminate synthase
VNHDGDPRRALELVRLAAEAGADAIKLQLFKADMLMSKAAKLAAYQKAAGETDPIEMLRRLELSIEDMKPCVDLAHELNIHAIVSVFSVELVEVAETLPWDAYKTASPDIINKPLLDVLAKMGKPLIVSTGASTIQEVAIALKWLHPIRDRLTVLQCVSSYPTSRRHAEFGGIQAIAEIFPGAVGYSDHTSGPFEGRLAVGVGACVLEKHFTYDQKAIGPDHAASLSLDDFKTYVQWSRQAHSMMMSPPTVRAVFVPVLDDEHDPNAIPVSVREATIELLKLQTDFENVKRVLPIEQDVRTVSRQSLTTTRDLPAGHVLTSADLTIKRPGTGIPPFELDATLGKRLTRSIEADMPLMAGDVCST